MKPCEITGDTSTKWKYRVIAEYADKFVCTQFRLKADAESYFNKMVFDDAVQHATCDKGTSAYMRYDADKQPQYNRSYNQ